MPRVDDETEVLFPVSRGNTILFVMKIQTTQAEVRLTELDKLPSDLTSPLIIRRGSFAKKSTSFAASLKTSDSVVEANQTVRPTC